MSRLTSVFDVQVNEIGRVCIDIPVDDRTSEGNIALEASKRYGFRQPGHSNTGILQIQVVPSVGDTPIDLVMTTTDGVVSYVPSDSTVANGLVATYHGRLTSGNMEQLTQTQYKSYLDQDGDCYLRLVMPATLPASSVLRISAAGFGTPPNVYKCSLINEKARVQTGDYIWLEAVLEEKGEGDDVWVPITNSSAAVIADRMICSVALKRDDSIAESNIYL